MSRTVVVRKYGYLTLIFLLVALASWGVYVLGDRLFEIRNIEVLGSGVKIVVNEPRIAKNLLFFPTDKLREEILVDNPLVSEVIFQKKLPHTLAILAEPRIPLAAINSETGFKILDKSGVVLGDHQVGSDLPMLLFTIASIAPGQKIGDQPVLRSLLLIDKTQTFIKLTSVEATGSAALLAKTSKINILIPQQGNLLQLAATLQTLITGFRIKGTLPAIIDLRFDKPIVKF